MVTATVKKHRPRTGCEERGRRAEPSECGPAAGVQGADQVRQLAEIEARANGGSHVRQLQALQGALNPGPETPAQRQTATPPANRTGLPDGLRTGLEQLSGHDLSALRVHYDSAKPAQLNAHAYTQGRDIHVAPGQDRHLPHEGWHAVQQMQGRVRPTMELGGTAINDDVGLEREADVMGARALGKADRPALERRPATESGSHPVQQVPARSARNAPSRSPGVAQLNPWRRLLAAMAGAGAGAGATMDFNRRRQLGIRSTADMAEFQDLMEDRFPDVSAGSSLIVPFDRGLNPYRDFAMPMIYTPFEDRELMHSHVVEVRRGEDGQWTIVDDRGFMGSGEEEGVTREHAPFRSESGEFDLSRFNIRTNQIVPGSMDELLPRTLASGDFCSSDYSLLGGNNCQTFVRAMRQNALTGPPPSPLWNPLSYMLSSMQSRFIRPQVTSGLEQQIPFGLSPRSVTRGVEVLDLLNPYNLVSPTPVLDRRFRSMIDSGLQDELEAQRGASRVNRMAFSVFPIEGMVRDEVYSQFGLPSTPLRLGSSRTQSSESELDPMLEMLLLHNE